MNQNLTYVSGRFHGSRTSTLWSGRLRSIVIRRHGTRDDTRLTLKKSSTDFDLGSFGFEVPAGLPLFAGT